MAEATPVHVRLSLRQGQVLEAVYTLKEEKGFAPSAREITKEVGLSSVSTTHAHLRGLRDKGLVDWCPGLVRTLRLTALGESTIRYRML